MHAAFTIQEGKYETTRQSSRSSTVWLGGVRADWDEAYITSLLQPHEIVSITVRRKGWRDEETRERIGFALVELVSEAAAERVLEQFDGVLNVRRHRWHQCSPDSGSSEADDPLAPLLLAHASDTQSDDGCATYADDTALSGMPSLEEQLEPLTISQARLRLARFGCGDTSAAESCAQARGGRVEKKAWLIRTLCRLHRTLPRAFPRRNSWIQGTRLCASVVAPLLAELRATSWPRKKRNVDAQHYLVLGVPSAGVTPKARRNLHAATFTPASAACEHRLRAPTTSVACERRLRAPPHASPIRIAGFTHSPWALVSRSAAPWIRAPLGARVCRSSLARARV